MSATFRSLRAEDKELFKSFIRSLPRKDNYDSTVDVHDDRAMGCWTERVEVRRDHWSSRSRAAR